VKPLLLLADSAKPGGVCSGCGAALVWWMTPAGRAMPMDATAAPLRTEYSPDLGVFVAVFDRQQAHWATCPDASRFRSPRRSRPSRPTQAGLFAE